MPQHLRLLILLAGVLAGVAACTGSGSGGNGDPALATPVPPPRITRSEAIQAVRYQLRGVLGGPDWVCIEAPAPGLDDGSAPLRSAWRVDCSNPIGGLLVKLPASLYVQAVDPAGAPEVQLVWAADVWGAQLLIDSDVYNALADCLVLADRFVDVEVQVLQACGLARRVIETRYETGSGWTNAAFAAGVEGWAEAQPSCTRWPNQAPAALPFCSQLCIEWETLNSGEALERASELCDPAWRFDRADYDLIPYERRGS